MRAVTGYGPETVYGDLTTYVAGIVEGEKKDIDIISAYFRIKRR